MPQLSHLFVGNKELKNGVEYKNCGIDRRHLSS